MRIPKYMLTDDGQCVVEVYPGLNITFDTVENMVKYYSSFNLKYCNPNDLSVAMADIDTLKHDMRIIKQSIITINEHISKYLEITLNKR